MIKSPQIPSLDQGCIFTCGVGEDYSGCEVFGLVITARCDIAQEKVPVFTYLPVVHLDDWLHRDGRLILANRVTRDRLGSLKNQLSRDGFSTSILSTETPRSILKRLYEDSNLNTTAIDNFRANVGEFEIAEKCYESSPSEKMVVNLLNRFRRIRERMITELVQIKLSGHYFLPKVSVGGDNLGYVILLREIRHIPRGLAVLISRGLSKEEYRELCNSNAFYESRLDFCYTDFSMPIGQLESPWVEHLMQNFALLFGRVGIDDLPRDYIDDLWSRQPTFKGDQDG